MVIYIKPKIIVTGVVTLAGLVGIGYGVSAKKKKEKIDTHVTDLERKDEISDLINRSVQEAAGQADAVIVDIVNAMRINKLLEKLSVIDSNKKGATEEISILKAEVKKLLESNRGGANGIHGFLGETSQVHISNVKAFMNGNEPLYILLDDNSMTDYTRGMQLIQQKACQSGGNLGLDFIKRHKETYKEFVEQGGIYQIPKDMYAKYVWLKNLPEETALKLRKEDVRLWRYIRNFSKEHSDVIIEPMEVSYDDIQAGNIHTTIKRVEETADTEFERQRNDTIEAHSPTIEEFVKVCGVSSVIEGGVSAGVEFIHKIKAGKKLSEFTKADAKDIFKQFAIGSGKGAIRGGVVYVMINVFKFSATLISGTVTVAFGIVREGYLYLKNKITKEEFIKNSSFVVGETAFSTFGAVVGKKLCKRYPVIGTLVGSIVGSFGFGCMRRTVFA